MTTDTTLVKRRALYKGEQGLFPNNEMSSEDFALISLDSEVMVSMRSEKKLEAFKFLWGLVYKATQNSSFWTDHHVAMDWFKVKVGYTKPGRDPDTKEWVRDRPRSLKRISEAELHVVTERVMDVICAEILPGITRKHLRAEVEDWLGLNTKSETRRATRKGV